MPISTKQLLSLPNLKRGSTGANVKTLQQWLVENGHMTQAEMDTGPGIFGSKTKRAVAKWQSSAGFDTKGNPGAFGPLSKAFLRSGETSTDINKPSGKSYIVADGSIKTPTSIEVEQNYIKFGFKVAGGPSGGIKGTKEIGEVGTTPKWLSDDDLFKLLPPDEQEYMVSYYNILSIQDEENQRVFAQALLDAEADANPYFAEKIRMAKDELTRALGGQTEDFASNKRDLELRIQQIGEDLTTGRKRLSIDEQAELARQKKRYEGDLENLIETVSHRGLTFSTKRALAEGRLKEEQTDIVESTKRQFQRKIKDLQTAASRGEVAAQNLLKDYERTYGENVTSLIRGSEAIIGTRNLPSDLPTLEGVSPLGGVIGTLAEDKQTDILQRAEALSNLRNPFIK